MMLSERGWTLAASTVIFIKQFMIPLLFPLFFPYQNFDISIRENLEDKQKVAGEKYK